MWELHSKESWALKNWCFWSVVLEKTLESPLDCKEIQPVHPKGNQSCIFIGLTDAKAETLILWPPDSVEKTLMLGKIEVRTTEDEMVGWHHQLDGHEFEWTLGVGDGQGGLACCDSWGCRVGHDWVNWTEWLMRLDIFSWAYLPFVCSLQGNVSLFLWPIFRLNCLFVFNFYVMRVVCVF